WQELATLDLTAARVCGNISGLLCLQRHELPDRGGQPRGGPVPSAPAPAKAPQNQRLPRVKAAGSDPPSPTTPPPCAGCSPTPTTSGCGLFTTTTAPSASNACDACSTCWATPTKSSAACRWQAPRAR